jgi:hypothetical protein
VSPQEEEEAEYVVAIKPRPIWKFQQDSRTRGRMDRIDLNWTAVLEGTVVDRVKALHAWCILSSYVLELVHRVTKVSFMAATRRIFFLS